MKTYPNFCPDSSSYNTDFKNFVAVSGQAILRSGMVMLEPWESPQSARIVAKFETNGEAALALLKAGWRHAPCMGSNVKLVKFL